MPRKKDALPKLTPKKAVAAQVSAKRPVGRPKKAAPATAAEPKRRGRPPKAAAAQKAPAKKTVPSAPTSALVNAQPLSSVSPAHPEQLLYDSDSMREPVPPPEPPGKKTTRTKTALRRGAATEAATAQPPLPPAAPATPPLTQDPAPAVTPEPEAVSSVPKVPVRRRTRTMLLALTAIVLLAGGWYFFAHRTPDYAAENSRLVAAVSKLTIVPPDETPSVTTVVDETKINQEFLRNAKKGDKVLLYFQSGRAIVYRPSTNQIVNIGPLETPKPRVFIRKGSATDNTAAVRTAIAKTSDFLLASQDESPNKTYAKTVVVDVTGNRPDLAGKLAQMLRVNVVPLPAGEDRPDADLLVIVGSDSK